MRMGGAGGGLLAVYNATRFKSEEFSDLDLRADLEARTAQLRSEGEGHVVLVHDPQRHLGVHRHRHGLDGRRVHVLDLQKTDITSFTSIASVGTFC